MGLDFLGSIGFYFMDDHRYRLLLVRGLEHSGTTILDLSLGGNPQIVGLGEASRLLRQPRPSDKHNGPLLLRGSDRFSRLCTCGETASNCSVWGDYLPWLVDNDSEDMSLKVSSLLDRCAPRGSDAWGVDSYQDDLSLLSLPSDQFDIRIIHLVRDIRSWLPGRIKAARREGLSFSRVRAVARWIHVNNKFSRIFSSSLFPVLRLGYEEFAMQPELCLRMVCDWIGVPFSCNMFSPGLRSGSHVLLGNPLKNNNLKFKSIKYDASWMSGNFDHVSALGMFIPCIASMNRRFVYSNNFV